MLVSGCADLDVAQIVGVELLHDQSCVLLDAFLDPRQFVRGRAEGDDLKQKFIEWRIR